MIESRDGMLAPSRFSGRGSPHAQQVPERRDVRAIVCRQFDEIDVSRRRLNRLAIVPQGDAERQPDLLHGKI
jgi:hypothetical protein